MRASPFTVSVLHPPAAGLGFLGALRRRGRHVFAAGGTSHRPTLLHARDGRSFRRLNPPRVSGLRDVLPLEGGGILVCGEYGMLARSDDRGETWAPRPLRTQGCLYALARDAEGVLHVAGDDGGLWRSFDGGGAWKKRALRVGARILGLAVVGDTLVLLDGAGDVHLVHGEGSRRVSLSASPLTGLAVLPTGTMIAVGDGGVVRRSCDGGRTWDAIAVPTDVDLEDVAWIDHGLFVVGDRGTILHSVEDGLTFTRVPSRQRRHLWSILEDGAGALIGGDEGLVLRLAHRDEADEPPSGADGDERGDL